MINKRFTTLLPLFLLLLVVPSFSLNSDGVLLLSFKYSLLEDPLSVLRTWNYDDATPCSWNGVICNSLRVTGLLLPNSKLVGSITTDLGFIENLQSLDLSDNSLNGSIPDSIFNNAEIKVISLSGNMISGKLPESIAEMRSLQVLNVSDNAFSGKIPESLTKLPNLTVISLKKNHFSGGLPTGFSSVEVLDLSSNLLNGYLPSDFGGERLKYLNLSHNNITGSISAQFARVIAAKATVDLSFNNLIGAIPDSISLMNQKTESFTGNVELCGKPLKNLCTIPSTLSIPPNITSATATTISPAIAVIPKSMNSNPTSGNQNQSLKPAAIVGIVIADMVGIAILAMVVVYVYQLRKRKTLEKDDLTNPKTEIRTGAVVISKLEPEPMKDTSCLCLKGEQTSDSDQDEGSNVIINFNQNQTEQKGGKLVIVDGETKLEVETLLMASAYVLGSSGGSITYKAVLADGTSFAVRRIGQNGLEKFKDFEHQVRAIAKLRHPNLVQVRGFYWANDEKLVISDFASNGSLSTSFIHRKVGSSPSHLSLEDRLKIARGVARGLSYIHDKKQVHGNIKPSNILLNSETDPVIADFGLDNLILGQKGNNSDPYFSSHRSNASQDHLPSSSSSSSISASVSPYQAPECLKNLKPNHKWDVYSFGVILLELFAGRVVSERELELQLSGFGLVEEKNRVAKMVDVAIRGDMEGREDAVMACFRLGFRCASFGPQRRPSMKEALHILEKI